MEIILLCPECETNEHLEISNKLQQVPSEGIPKYRTVYICDPCGFGGFLEDLVAEREGVCMHIVYPDGSFYHRL